MPVAKSQPGVSPDAGWYAGAGVPTDGDAEQAPPVPPPPDIVQLVPPAYPWPPPEMVMVPTPPPDLVAVQLADDPPAQRVVPVGERYELVARGAERAGGRAGVTCSCRSTGARRQRLRAEDSISARRQVAAYSVTGAVVSTVHVDVALSYVVEHARGGQASTRRLIDGVAGTVAARAELGFGDGIVRRVRIAHLGQTPLLIHQRLDGGHHRRSDRCSAKAAPRAGRARAGLSPLGRIREADGGEVPPDAVRGKERNVRNIAYAVGRVAEDAGLPRGLGIPRARPVHLEIAGLVGSSSPGGAATRAAAARGRG